MVILAPINVQPYLATHSPRPCLGNESAFVFVAARVEQHQPRQRQRMKHAIIVIARLSGNCSDLALLSPTDPGSTSTKPMTGQHSRKVLKKCHRFDFVALPPPRSYFWLACATAGIEDLLVRDDVNAVDNMVRSVRLYRALRMANWASPPVRTGSHRSRS